MNSTCAPQRSVPITLDGLRPIAVTLWDIMKRFQAADCSDAVSALTKLALRAVAGDPWGGNPGDPGSTVNTGDIDMIEAVELHIAHLLCVALGLEQSNDAIRDLYDRLNDGEITWGDLGGRVEALRKQMEREMLGQLYLIVPRPLAHFYEKEPPMGEVVHDAFPGARSDSTHAGNCIACGEDTAAVFHLMRVVEVGLRALCASVGMAEVQNGCRQDGVAKLIPIAYSEWERILRQARAKIDAMIEAMPRGPEKQRAQEFYYPALNEIEAIKHAWRNHVMHSRAEYTSEDAVAIFGHVKRLMVFLADNGIMDAPLAHVEVPEGT